MFSINVTTDKVTLNMFDFKRSIYTTLLTASIHPLIGTGYY